MLIFKVPIMFSRTVGFPQCREERFPSFFSARLVSCYVWTDVINPIKSQTYDLSLGRGKLLSAKSVILLSANEG